MAINLEEFKKEISTLKKNENNSILINNILELKDYNYINYTENQEINDFLNEKGFNILNFLGKSNIFLGTIFLEVQNYLDENSIEETTYCAWLESIGFNRMTALRYKKRAELFQRLNNKKSKNFIALLNQKSIDDIHKSENKEKILEAIEKSSNLNEVIKYLDSFHKIENKTEEKEEIIIEADSISLEDRVSRIRSTDIKNLKPEKQKKIDSLLKKIEKIIAE